MHHPRQRRARSGTPQLRLRRPLHLFLAAAAALILSACGSNIAPTGKSVMSMQAVEAEAAQVAGSSFVIREEAGTSGDQVLVQPADVQAASVPAEDATVAFSVSTTGDYILWARLKAASEGFNAVFLGFDGSLERVDLFRYGQYVWVAVTSQELTAGDHVISIGAAQPETSIDTLVVANRRDLRHDDLESFVLTGQLPEPSPEQDPNPEQDPEQDPAPDPGKTPAADPAPALPDLSKPFDLRGDPNFDRSDLPGEAQIWHRRLWAAIDSTDYAYDWARSDNLYRYARDLHTHVQFLLHAFRATGDLELLDELDKILQIMRGKLHDSWRDVRTGSASAGKDGFLNWVWRGPDGDDHYGKDNNKLDEIKTHAMIASVVWAFEVNRDLKSPGGVNYGARADFWTDYMTDHFEAKWRKREKKATGFPIMTRPHTHTYYSWTKWHYYMALITGDNAYMKEAERMARMLERDVVEVSTKSGPALVWARSVLVEGGKEDYLHPTTYARYVYHDAIEFYWEGFGWWDSKVLESMARTFATWVIDPEHAKGSSDWFTSDIGGGVKRGGIDSSSSWSRMTYNRYETSAYAQIAPWDKSGRIDDITDRVIAKVGGADRSRYAALPTAKLITAMLN